MKLSVAVVALYPAPDGKAPGGVRAVVQNLVRGLRTYDDLALSIIHCHSDIEKSATVAEDGLAIHYIAMPSRRLVPNTLASIRRVEELLRELQPHVVNAHAAHYTVAALRAGFPTVYTIHGVVHREAKVYQSTLFDRLRFGLEAACDRYAVARVSDIVAISPYVLEEYRGRGRARFHRIDNPLPNEFFSIPNLREEARLLYAGTIDERKNVLGLLRALVLVRQRVPQVRLRVAGRPTSQRYYQQVKQFVSAHGLESHVDFLGLLKMDELLQEYARCAASVLASRQETAPMAVIEAMAAGKPVVATRVGGVPDLVQDGYTGWLVEPDDTSGFADKVVDLLTNGKLCQRMGAQARQLAERFSLRTIAGRYRQLYYELAGRSMP
jgi:glycosyltransferase involved in cell wall biosynthesis